MFDGRFFMPFLAAGLFWLGWRYGHYFFGVDRRSWLRRAQNRYHL